MGGGDNPPTVSPRCPGSVGARSASAWPSVSLPAGCYIYKLGRISALPLPGTPSCTPWDRRPCLLRHLPEPVPPLLCHVGFGGAQPVTPSPSPSHTPGSSTAPTVAPCSSSLPPSPAGYKLCLTATRPPGMGGTPYPRYS